MNATRLVGLVLCLAACSGSHARSVPSVPVPARAPDTYLAAAVAGAHSDCLGRALIAGVGVARLRAAGVTPADLRSSVYALPAGIGRSMTRAERAAFGTRLHTCGFCGGNPVLTADIVLFARPQTAADAVAFATIRCRSSRAFSLRP